MSSTSIPASDRAASNALLVREGDGSYRPASAEEVLQRARQGPSHRVRRGATMTSPRAVRDYLLLAIGVLEPETFFVIFLDSQHRLLALKEMFRSSVTQTTVYAREVVREALVLNASAVVVAHNHPSGCPEPSLADERLTECLVDALRSLEIRVLAHLVVTADEIVSFAKRGLI